MLIFFYCFYIELQSLLLQVGGCVFGKFKIVFIFPSLKVDMGIFFLYSNSSNFWPLLVSIYVLLTSDNSFRQAPVLAILATILIFMDQQITAVIVNRKDFMLKKGGGYHLDLLVLALIITVCSIFGLPWFVAATVLSINHIQSLTKESEGSAPGEKPQFLGIREQRITNVMIGVAIGLSTLITPILALIPMPVLYGIFLYMGVSSLKVQIQCVTDSYSHLVCTYL